MIQLRKMNMTPLAIYRYKMAFFKKYSRALDPLRFKLAPIRLLKWHTLYSQTPSGSKNTSCHRRKDKNSICLSKDLLRWIYFLFFQLWQLVFLEPPGLQECNVPHFKGLISANSNLKSSKAWQHFYLLLKPHELDIKS